ncbi:MAG: Sulfotransferase family protein [Candidatus Nitrotoga sp. MKT]|nr:MAG: Sulfotransferase family protein [Candidatus Nitrotoga sp. MKT]
MGDVDNWPLADKVKLFGYLRWNSYCSKKYKLLYVATPKVACTSLKWWFADLEHTSKAIRDSTGSTETSPELVIHDTFFKVAPNVTGLLPDALLEPLTSNDYFRFAVVRNPYKRIFSAWQSKLLLREPLQVTPYLGCDFYNQPIEKASDIALAFEGFLEHLFANEASSYWDIHWTPQVDLLRPDLINYTKLVRIEDAKVLSQSLAMHLGENILDPFAARHTNESLIPYLPEFITERSSELILLLYAADFEIFGYSKQPPRTEELFSDGQFDVALKAIAIIRGRHQRFGEVQASMRDQIARISKEMIRERDETIHAQTRLIDERAEGMRIMEGMIQERDATIVAQVKLIDERVDGMRIMEGMIQERGATISAQTKLIDECNERMRIMEGVVRERDGQIASLNQALVVCDARIQGFYSSRSWRLTRPLRFLARFIRGD